MKNKLFENLLIDKAITAYNEYCEKHSLVSFNPDLNLCHAGSKHVHLINEFGFVARYNYKKNEITILKRQIQKTYLIA